MSDDFEFPLCNEWQRRRIGLEAFVPAVQVMAQATQDWCYRVYRRDIESRMIVLTGPFGFGKTECLNAAKTYVRDVRQAIWPVPWPRPLTLESINFGDFIREQVKNGNREQWEDVTSADVLTIDDIGSESDEFKGGATTRILGDLLGCMEKRFVFITTNIAINGWADRWDGRVQDRLLRSNSTVINLWKPELQAQSYAVWKRMRKAA